MQSFKVFSKYCQHCSDPPHGLSTISESKFHITALYPVNKQSEQWQKNGAVFHIDLSLKQNKRTCFDTTFQNGMYDCQLLKQTSKQLDLGKIHLLPIRVYFSDYRAFQYFPHTFLSFSFWLLAPVLSVPAVFFKSYLILHSYALPLLLPTLQLFHTIRLGK